ncbi:MAG: hypothetical protein IK127_06505 [Clostridia bacterium]|nr:hypothetical protein [Clostridia bacterium]
MIPNRTSNRILIFLAGIIAIASGILMITVETVTVNEQLRINWKLASVFTRNELITISGSIAIIGGICLLFCFAAACIITAFRRFQGKKIRWFWFAFLIVVLVLLLIGFLAVNNFSYHRDGTSLGNYTVGSYEVQTTGWILFAVVAVAGVLYCIHLLIGQSHRYVEEPSFQSYPETFDPGVRVSNNQPASRPNQQYPIQDQPPARYPYRQQSSRSSTGTWICKNCRYTNSDQQNVCQQCGLRRNIVTSSPSTTRKY